MIGDRNGLSLSSCLLKLLLCRREDRFALSCGIGCCGGFGCGSPLLVPSMVAVPSTPLVGRDGTSSGIEQVCDEPPVPGIVANESQEHVVVLLVPKYGGAANGSVPRLFRGSVLRDVDDGSGLFALENGWKNKQKESVNEQTGHDPSDIDLRAG